MADDTIGRYVPPPPPPSKPTEIRPVEADGKAQDSGQEKKADDQGAQILAATGHDGTSTFHPQAQPGGPVAGAIGGQNTGVVRRMTTGGIDGTRTDYSKLTGELAAPSKSAQGAAVRTPQPPALSPAALKLGTTPETQQALEYLRARSPTAREMIDGLAKGKAEVKVTLTQENRDATLNAGKCDCNSTRDQCTVEVSIPTSRKEQHFDETKQQKFSRSPEVVLAHELGHAFIETQPHGKLTEEMRSSYSKANSIATKDVDNSDLAIQFENTIASELDPKAPQRYHSHQEIDPAEYFKQLNEIHGQPK